MTAENRIKGLIQIRDCVRKLIEYQTDDYPEEMIRTEQETSTVCMMFIPQNTV